MGQIDRRIHIESYACFGFNMTLWMVPHTLEARTGTSSNFFQGCAIGQLGHGTNL